MKELFVEERHRGLKIGEQLMDALRHEAELQNCQQIKWTVAPWSEPGKRFYERLVAKANRGRINYQWNL